MPKIAFVMGTRPEVIKLAPVVLESRRSNILSPFILCTGQHVHLCPQALNAFGLTPDLVLELHRDGSDLASLSATLLLTLGKAFASTPLDAIVVQGDTSTALVAGLAAFYAKIPVFHVEAGLRTHDLDSPWPEEANRQMLSRIAAFHFPPTTRARDNLLSEGVSERNMEVTGNTIVDAIEEMRPNLPARVVEGNELRTLLVTGHRRENATAGIDHLCEALLHIAARGDCRVVFPVHPSPGLRSRIEKALSGTQRIELIPAQDYPAMLALLRDSYLILTDSGGIQEEAPSFGKPVLVFRDNTERPEAVESGCARIVGTQTSSIVETVGALLDDSEAYRRMVPHRNPFGDGYAGSRIVQRIANELERLS